MSTVTSETTLWKYWRFSAVTSTKYRRIFNAGVPGNTNDYFFRHFSPCTRKLPFLQIEISHNQYKRLKSETHKLERRYTFWPISWNQRQIWQIQVSERYLNLDRIHDWHFGKYYTICSLNACSEKPKWDQYMPQCLIIKNLISVNQFFQNLPYCNPLFKKSTQWTTQKQIRLVFPNKRYLWKIHSSRNG